MLRQAHRRSVVLWLSFLLLVLTLAFSGAASATLWQNGDEITYTQAAWGDDLPPLCLPLLCSPAPQLLVNNFNNVYATTGNLEVGIPGLAGFSIVFSDGSAVHNFLPQKGASGPLDSDLLDPATSSAGAWGGEVVALQLNVDFSDAGFLLGASGIPFGDLLLENFTTLPNLNGLTVRQFLGDVNVLLGGGTSIYTIADIDLTTASLNGSFLEGTVGQFALDHLVAPTAAVPEPTTMLLLGSGLIGLVGYGRKKLFRK